MNVAEARALGKQRLLNSSPTPQLDADCILKEILRCDQTFILFHREHELLHEQEEAFMQNIARRMKGLPVAYITGHREFFGRDFSVNPDVLIPKPDTELLVENALSLIGGMNLLSEPAAVCDMCCGSGCVGLSILAECRDTLGMNLLPRLTLADISQKALEVTRMNVSRLELDESGPEIVCSNLFERIDGQFDLIVANPPYIPAEQAIKLLEDGRSEPLLALDGDVDIDGTPASGHDGLGIIRNLVPQAYGHLKPCGTLMLETGEYNASGAALILEQNGFRDIKILRDMNGQDRNVIGTKQA